MNQNTTSNHRSAAATGPCPLPSGHSRRARPCLGRWLVLAGVLLLLPAPAAALNLVPNANLKNADPTDSTKPQYWSSNSWGDYQAWFAYTTKSSSGGTTTYWLRVEVFSGSSGDAKWVSDPFPLQASGTFSGGNFKVWDTYRSTTASELMLRVTNAAGSTQYLSVASLTSSGGNLASASGVVSVPAGTAKVELMHVIKGKGYLETTAYGLEAAAAGTDGGSALKDGGTAGTDAGSGASDAGGATTGAVVSVVFDDGWTSVYQYGLPVMKQLGVRATHFIHADYVDKTGYTNDYMSSAKLKAFHALGHEIGSHAWDKNWGENDEYKDAVKLGTHVQGAKVKLEGFGFKVVGFAPPNGKGTDNAAAMTALKQHYKYLRTIVDGHNPNPPPDPYALRARIVTPSITQATFKAWVDSAKQNGTWLVLLYHRLAPSPKYATEISPTDFKTQLQTVQNAGLSIKPMGEVLGVWSPQTASLTDDGGTTTPSDLGGTPWPDGGGTSWPDAGSGPVVLDRGIPYPDAAPPGDAAGLSFARPPVDLDDGCTLGGASSGGGPVGVLLALALLGLVRWRPRRE